MTTTTDTHLGDWTRVDGATFRLCLFDTGEVGEYGKQRLRYVLSIFPETRRPVHFEGNDFFPSPGLDPSSDECAGALLSFFHAYGETIAFGGDDVPEYTREQRWTLGNYWEALGLWSVVLDPNP